MQPAVVAFLFGNAVFDLSLAGSVPKHTKVSLCCCVPARGNLVDAKDLVTPNVSWLDSLRDLFYLYATLFVCSRKTRLREQMQGTPRTMNLPYGLYTHDEPTLQTNVWLLADALHDHCIIAGG